MNRYKLTKTTKAHLNYLGYKKLICAMQKCLYKKRSIKIGQRVVTTSRIRKKSQNILRIFHEKCYDSKEIIVEQLTW